jgi:hypothetical protein
MEFAGDAERHSADLEGLDARLTQLEESLVSSLRNLVDDGVEQFAECEKRQFDSELLERFALHRLGIYYMR